MKSTKESPQSLVNLVSLAKLYEKEKQKEEARNTYQKALEMAKTQKVGTWYINQLEAYASELK